MDLLGKLFWVLVYIVCTFAFVVLFEHGTDNYVHNARKTLDDLVLQIKNPEAAKQKR